MSLIKLSISFFAAAAIFSSCSQPDQAQCACLKQAQKVNRLSEVIWSSNATHNDTLLLKKALQKKQAICKKLEQSAPETLQNLKEVCPQ
jgi:hypothetical protein